MEIGPIAGEIVQISQLVNLDGLAAKVASESQVLCDNNACCTSAMQVHRRT